MIDHHELLNRAEAPIRERVERKSRDLAIAEKPSTDAEVYLFQAEVQAAYQDLGAQIPSWYMPETNRTGSRADLAVAEQSFARATAEIEEEEHRVRVYQMDHPLSKSFVVVPLKALALSIGTIGIVWGQIRWEKGAFLSSGTSSFDSAIIATAVVLGLGFVGHGAVLFLRMLKRRAWKVAFAVALEASVFLAYLVVGQLRAHAITMLADFGDDLDLSPVRFALLSTLMWNGILFLSLVLMPAAEEFQQFWNRFATRRTLRKKERGLKIMKAKRDAIPARLARTQEQRAAQIERANLDRQRVHQLYRSTWIAAVQTNTSRRRIPPPASMFTEPPPLNF